MRGRFTLKPPKEPPSLQPAAQKASDGKQSFSPSASSSHGAALSCTRDNAMMTMPAATVLATA